MIENRFFERLDSSFEVWSRTFWDIQIWEPYVTDSTLGLFDFGNLPIRKINDRKSIFERLDSSFTVPGRTFWHIKIGEPYVTDTRLGLFDFGNLPINEINNRKSIFERLDSSFAVWSITFWHIKIWEPYVTGKVLGVVSQTQVQGLMRTISVDHTVDSLYSLRKALQKHRDVDSRDVNLLSHGHIIVPHFKKGRPARKKMVKES